VRSMTVKEWPKRANYICGRFLEMQDGLLHFKGESVIRDLGDPLVLGDAVGPLELVRLGTRALDHEVRKQEDVVFPKRQPQRLASLHELSRPGEERYS